MWPRIRNSYVEHLKLTMRMGTRQFTRLTNGFGKKVENHAHSVALHMLRYNLTRVYKALRVTPAMQAGICDHVWSIEEMANLVQIGRGRSAGPARSVSRDGPSSPAAGQSLRVSGQLLEPAHRSSFGRSSPIGFSSRSARPT